eukprot:g5084.t1
MSASRIQDRLKTTCLQTILVPSTSHDFLWELRSSTALNMPSTSGQTRVIESSETPLYYGFAPCFIVWFCTAATLTREHLWWDTFAQYWLVALCMVASSPVSGTTPLGSGVLSLPMAVLMLKFSLREACDVSLLTQSVALSCAAFLICIDKERRSVLRPELLILHAVGATIGISATLWLFVDEFIVSLLYALTTLAFALFHMYHTWVKPDFCEGSDYLIMDTEQDMEGVTIAQQEQFIAQQEREERWQRRLRCTSAILFATVGGFTTAHVGTGSSLAFFAHGSLIGNGPNSVPFRTLAANSLVVMAFASILAAMLRFLTGSALPLEVLHCWAVLAAVACVGSSLGALLLTSSKKSVLRFLFYSVAILEFAGFVLLKVGANGHAWKLIAVVFSIEMVCIASHYWHTVRGPLLTDWNEGLQKLYDTSMMSASFSQAEKMEKHESKDVDVADSITVPCTPVKTEAKTQGAKQTKTNGHPADETMTFSSGMGSTPDEPLLSSSWKKSAVLME